ncbi:HEAT repeat domain-containing protein [Stigmatella hybrida]|uniref:HEAT repeat domain-containing protein n=1 Tax=Stigmatella hybrida TaxID=394097 RepID=UPI001CDA68E4|nr:HEAT repeat domain-containing protein [Stigmatella hybrida]
MDWRAERDRALLVLEREKSPAVRADAADLLFQLAAEEAGRAPEFAGVLTRLLADAQGEVRRSGLGLATLVLPQGELIDTLSARLSDLDVGARLEAVGRLADLALPEVRGALAPMLQDAVPEIRFEAARGMASLKHSAGLDVLVEALDNESLRFRALGALAELEDPRALPAVKKLFRRWLLSPFERTQAAGVLAKLGDTEGVEWLVKRLQKRWSTDRALAVELCGEVKIPNALERLKAILESPKDPCRGAAARGLGRLGEPAALPWLLALLEDPGAPEDFRLDAAEGLWRLGLPEGQARVRAAAASFTSPEVRAELDELLQEMP